MKNVISKKKKIGNRQEKIANNFVQFSSVLTYRISQRSCRFLNGEFRYTNRQDFLDNYFLAKEH